MRKPMPVTTSAITAASGSISRVHDAWNETPPFSVTAGIGGIHSPRTTARAIGIRATLAVHAIASASDPSIDAHATAAVTARLNQRIPNSPLIAAPAAGNAGT